MDTLLPALETYQYISLQPADSTFRILKLSRYQRERPQLECELLQFSLSNDRHPPYEALSYVWGSAERVEWIVVNQKRFWVTDNLHSALRCLRLHNKDRYLWIDAICITTQVISSKVNPQSLHRVHSTVFDTNAIDFVRSK